MYSHHDEVGRLRLGKMENSLRRKFEAHHRRGVAPVFCIGRNQFFQLFPCAPFYIRLVLHGHKRDHVQQRQGCLVLFRQGQRVGKST